MKLNQLEALIAVADGYGIAGAANKLNISQPAITKSLRNLEEDVGVALLDRSEYRLKLTTYGEILLNRARAISTEVEKARLDIRLMQERNQQLLLYNSSPGPMPLLIPNGLQRAHEKMPGLLVEFAGELIGSTETKYGGLAQGLYDLLIYPVEKTHNVDNFICQPLMDIKLIVKARKGHPATKLRKPSLQELRKFAWLSPSKVGLPNRIIEEAFAYAGVKCPDMLLPLPLRSMIFAYLRNTDFLAFVPSHPAIDEEDTHEFLTIDADIPLMGWTLHLLQRKSSIPSKGMNTFITELKTIVTEAESSQMK